MNRFLPLLFFLPLAVIMFAGLQLNPRAVPSPLVGKPAPQFSLPLLRDAPETPPQKVSPENMKGKAWLLNVWASWCVGCRAEHALLLKMKDSGAEIVGLNYKDKAEEARDWLLQHGDPYVFSAADADGAAGLDWGVYGVPETFVVDGGGVIRYKHIGPLDDAAVEETILPLLKELQKTPS